MPRSSKPKYSYQDSAVVNGTSVTFTSSVRVASGSVHVTNINIAVRDSSGVYHSLPDQGSGTVTTSWLTKTGTATFAPGTYSYYFAFKVNGVWVDEPLASQKTFTVTKPVVVPPPVVTPPAPVTTSMPTGNVVSNGATFTPVYSEDFTTDAALGTVTKTYSKMGYYDGFKDTSGMGLYAPDKVLSVHDSALDFNMHSENGQPLGAVVLPDNYASHLHGRFSIRFKTTATGKGFKFVPLLWPSSDVWNDGEIDWPEADLTETPRPASAVAGSYANGNMTFVPPQAHYAPSDSSDWHVATTEWHDGIVYFYWDDVLVTSVTQGVPTKPMRYTVQAETFIGEGRVPAASSGHILVDWIVIYNQV